jgi:DNA-binding CsgD family transcriptional regulator
LRKILRKIEVRDPAITEIYQKLKELPDGVDWKAFEEEFEKVHPEFGSNISKKFPDLTPMELKLCALLRLNLNSRDISKLLSLSKRTIENHRHRIRQKLGIEGRGDIAKFLQGY